MAYTLHVFTEDQELKDLYANHKAKYQGDSGIDLFFPNDLVITPETGTNFISLGIKCWMTDPNGELTSYFLMARSSITKTPLILQNSVGLIDAGYRGDIMGAFLFGNLNHSSFEIKKGERLLQICAPNLKKIKVVLEDSLYESDRGENGFGSTGK